MDPLSISMGVLASLQVASSILAFCYDVRSGMQKIPWKLIQIIEEVRDVRNLVEAVQSVFDHGDSADSPGPEYGNASLELSEKIKPALATCLSELQALEAHIKPEHVAELLESKRKALFNSISWKLKLNDTKKSIANLQRCKEGLQLAITSHNAVTLRNVERLTISLDYKMNDSREQLERIDSNLSTAILDEQQKAIVDWLSPLRPGQAHKRALKSHQNGTSEWLLAGQEFQAWMKGEQKLLWLTGPLMMGQAIDSIAGLNQEDSLSAFAYCDFRDPDTQTLSNVLGTILAQLCTQLEEIPKDLSSAHKASMDQNYGYPPTIELLSGTIVSIAATKRIHLFVDAVDEVSDCKTFAEHLANLVDSTALIKIFVTSRNDVQIQRVFKNARRISLAEHLSDTDEDIQRFQWAACQLDSLSQCRTIRDIKRSLQKLPNGLDETYSRLLMKVPPSDVPLVQKTLTWLAFSPVPITLHELWEALAIEKGNDIIDDESRLRSPQDILMIGKSLITVSMDGHVMLSHLSVRDYLVSAEIAKSSETAKFSLRAEPSHRELAQDCLTYLLLSPLSSGPSGTQKDYLSRLKQLPLLKYATKYWFYHARNADYSEETQDLAMRFFSEAARQNFMSWVQVFNADAPFKWDVYPRHATSLYYASSLGLDEVVESLLQSATKEMINAPGSRFGGTALHAAAIREHVTIIKRLIIAGADPAKQDFNGVAPLHSAASQGSLDVIRVLLSNGAPIDVKDGMDGTTPVEWARLSGHENAASLLLNGLGERTSSFSSFSESPSSTRESRTTQSSLTPEVPQVELWQPGVGFFPDYYEKRSGLDSSLVLSITIGEEIAQVGGEFLQPLGKGDKPGSVW
ncbi:hypothetical protein CORC01_01555 [Colletotrichum orchidophilum]|uniref:Uncharacterized protein n=1 Tax=Colletotrichum orchidophilum TaxID=1209926 RepID=A0A1G4BNY8_9PEZI|nr:uncharacterized protein CORC01_01555 [Colletotrichum orchidophilum]OHF03171.1 hypothetical protein CORC01_01555 [Colletotrichum orchidophilum]